MIMYLQFFGGRGASLPRSGGSGGSGGAGGAEKNPEYNNFLKNHANLKKPEELKAGDKVISRIVTEDGKRKIEKWKGIGDDKILGTFEPRNDVKLTKVTKTNKQVKLEGIVEGNYGKKITVSKTINKNEKAYTRK